MTQRLLTQVAALRASGHPGRAAELCRQALAQDPRNAQWLHALASLLCELGWLREALLNCVKAGNLTQWQNPVINSTFRVIVRACLNHEDAPRCAATHAQHASWLTQTSRSEPGQTAVILDLPSTEARMAALQNIRAQACRPLEIVIPADHLDMLPPMCADLPFTGLEVPGSNPLERINTLVRGANAPYVLICGEVHAQIGELLRQLNCPAEARAWAMAYDATPLDRFGAIAITDSISGGFAILTSDTLGTSSTPFLVSRSLFIESGGFDVRESDPWLDLTLKLLWRAEPVLQRMSLNIPGGQPQHPLARTQRIERYLGEALRTRKTPNPFAPALCNWGLYLIRRVMLFNTPYTPDTLSLMAQKISAHAHVWANAKANTQSTPGVNFVGAACGELGLGENMRIIARACINDRLPCSVIDWPLSIQSGMPQGDHSMLPHFTAHPSHRCSVYFLQPGTEALYTGTGLDVAVFRKPQASFPHYKIGYWYWELETFPEHWRYALDKVDEVWVATDFVAETVRSVTDKPVCKIPPPINVSYRGNFSREYFKLPESGFLFLFSFDYASFPRRKNPEAVVTAFRKAFPDSRQDVSLVIKSVNGDIRPEHVAAFSALVDHDPRIHFINQRLSRDEVFGLQSVADCFVSLHRSEGLGLGLAECMFQGKPVIATNYSGNLEFMNPDNALLVDYTLIPVNEGDYVHDVHDAHWADADVDHAARQMRRLVDEPGLAERLGKAARQYILDNFNEAATARKVRARLNELGML